jgi:hypothetical protein
MSFAKGAQIVILTILGANIATASEVTPSHVFQAVDKVANELILIHQANESTLSKPSLKMQGRKPRHVIQKAREVYAKVQKLRNLIDLTVNPIPDFPSTEIIPSNVLDAVHLILNDVKELSDAFDVEKEAPVAKLLSGKTPNDVYLNLVRVGEMVDNLDIPETVPNDVYQIAQTIIGDINLILDNRKIAADLSLLERSKGKKPADVYVQGRALLLSIGDLCKKNEIFCLPGDVIIPSYHLGAIRPSEVLDTLNNALAELGSIKTNLGIKQSSVLAALPSGKTPSDVFDAVSTAIRLIDKIK